MQTQTWGSSQHQQQHPYPQQSQSQFHQPHHWQGQGQQQQHIHQHQHTPIQPRPTQSSANIKREPQHILPLLQPSSSSSSSKQPPPPQTDAMEDSMPSTSDFVKKLYKMLEDKSFQHIVSWGPAGDCFVVKDMNEFTKSILPRLFKHSNFASFVRQLNKYDFHKVKNTDDNTYGEHAWTFRHPDFHADRRDALENIKRKVPTSRKSQSTSNNNSASTTRPLGSRSGSPGPYYGSTQGPVDGYQVNALQNQIDRLTASHEELSSHIRSLERNIGGLERNLGGLERNYHEVLIEMVGFQRNMAQQDSVMQGLIEWVLRGGGANQQGGGEGKGKRPALDHHTSASTGSASTSSMPSLPTLPTLPSLQPQQQPPLSSIFPSESLPYAASSSSNTGFGANGPGLGGTGMGGVGRAALWKMNELSRRANEQQQGTDPQRPQSRLWNGLAGTDTNANGGDAFGMGMGGAQFNSTTGFGASSSSASAGASGSGSGMDAMKPPPTPPVRITSRQEALERIEELQRMRPASANFLSNAAAKLAGGLDVFEGLRRRGSITTPIVPGLKQEDGGRQDEREDQEEMVMPSSTSPSGASDQIQPQTQLSPSSSSGGGSSTSPPASSMITPSLYEPFPDLNMGDHTGLEIYTVGHLMPKNVADGSSGWNFGDNGNRFDGSNGLAGLVGTQESRVGDTNSGPFAPSSSASSPPSQSNNASSPNSASASSSGPKKLSVRRSTFVPGWTVSPRVLLVDDDAVSRKLSSKFLQVFGCNIDVAVDGVGAVNKMNLEKYDLVLMDIVMPKLDGVSATSMIRKFDLMTPIISMTSNAKPNEVMTYYSSGMNDVLPKPFTKQGMLDMLEKHLMHLKVIQQMSRGIPRSVGIPPLSDAGFEMAMTSHANNLIQQQSSSSSSPAQSLPFGSTNSSGLSLTNPAPSSGSGYEEGDGYGGSAGMERMTANPLAGMGLSDEQYGVILAGLVNGETFEGSMMGMGGSMGGMDGNGSYDGSSGMGQKRPFSGEDMDQQQQRAAKRSRFEVID
ncbi:kinase-regulated stress-responsive transcription factor skn7 [Marasmius tenuissimus]|nr:kinase-regulated stress-responsive transcription factor skn7 [Marasmius tenuissimus]